jgi:hypothetical protein
MPHKWVTRGKIIHNGTEYDLLSVPLSDEIWEKFQEIRKKYKEANKIGSTFSAPHMNSSSSWIVEDNKLYLTELRIKNIKDENDNTPKYKREIDIEQIIKNLDNEDFVSNEAPPPPRTIIMNNGVNVLSEIFPDQVRVFASFATQEVRIKLSSRFEGEYEVFKELHLEVVEGIIKSTKEIENKYTTFKAIMNYSDDEEEEEQR